ncbi:MAG: hypothetical protein JWQ83_1539 [Lacunisphaera sp.]|nr:hypothetical protein [Lacunisphaera sp.]
MPKSTKKPSHDEIALRAHQLWKERGSQHGQHEDHWLDAERQLTAAQALEADENHGHTPDSHVHHGTNTVAGLAEAGSAPGSATPATISPSPEPDKVHAQADQQKQTARAPQVPHHTGPARKPPESGKPIYPKPRSS